MNLWLWAILVGMIAVLAVVEFALLARRMRVIGPGEALAGTGLWVVAVGIFAAMLFRVYEHNWLGIESAVSAPVAGGNLGGDAALIQFLTVYVAEVALSLDNIAVLSLLMAFYKVPSHLTARVLYWAVTFALVLRLLVIFAVGPLTVAFWWVPYVFAGLLVVAAVRTLLIPDGPADFSKAWLPRMIGRLVPIAPEPDGAKLTTRITTAGGKVRRAITPLTALVLVVALSDITYAADFLPAAYSVTADPFIAAAGNAFALLTLRSLYFTIAPFMGRFRFLRLSLVFIMLFIAGNTIFYFEHLRATEVTFWVVVVALLVGVVASVLVNRRKGVRTLEVEGRAVEQGMDPADVPRPAPIDDIIEVRRHLRKVLILMAGTAVIVLGIIIAPLPGPGFTILAPVGVAILATEFVWARSLMDKLKDEGQRLAKRSDAFSKRFPNWLGWLVLPLWGGLAFGLWWLMPEKSFWRTLVMATGFGLSFPIGVWCWRQVRR